MTFVAADESIGAEIADADLRGRSVRGGAITILGQGCRFVLMLASMAILARLLTPTDFGLLAMAFAITSFGEMFSQLGLSMATIQKPDISDQQVNAMFWLNVALGVAALLAVELLAPVIGWFYGDVRLVGISRMLGFMFVLGALATQHRALLSRQMRFMALSGIDILAQSVGVAVGVLMAWRGMGYWALVSMYLARDATATVGLWWRSRWRPGWPAGCPELRSLIRFGANITGGQFIGNLARQCDSLLLGWWSGPFVLGLYSKAYQLAMLTTQQVDVPLTRVLIPALSRLQADTTRYREYYLKGAMLLAALEMPIVAFIFVNAPQVVHVVLGPQWESSALIFRILAPAVYLWPVATVMDWAFVSLGRVERQLRWEVVCSGLLVLAFLAGVCWGAVGMASAFAITYCTVRVGYVSLRYCLRGAPVGVADVVGAVWRPVVASITAAALIGVAQWFEVRGSGSIVGLLLRLAQYGVLYLLVWFMLPHGGKTVLALVQALRTEFIPARGAEIEVSSSGKAAPAKTITVVLRYDDCSSVSRTDLECQIIGSLRRHRLHCTFAAVPASITGSQEDLRRQQHLPLQAEKAEILRDAARDGTVEVALHGYSHQTRRRRLWSDYSEFHGGSASEQRAKVDAGKQSLEQLLGFEITTFVPPWNTYDTVTLEALRNAGFRAISADLGGSPDPSANIKSMPATCTLDQVQGAVRSARSSRDPAPTIGVLFHEFDFAEVHAAGPWDVASFDRLLAWLSAQPDVRVRTVGQQAHDGTSLDRARLRLLHAAHIASRLAPYTGAGPRVCWSSIKACWASLLLMWVWIALFYGSMLCASVGIAHLARSFLRGSGASPAGLLSLLILAATLACAVVSLRNADRRIKLSAAVSVALGVCAGFVLAWPQ